jgi:hypothetical protein
MASPRRVVRESLGKVITISIFQCWTVTQLAAVLILASAKSAVKLGVWNGLPFSFTGHCHRGYNGVGPKEVLA